MPFADQGTVLQRCGNTPTHCVYTFDATIATGDTRAAVRTDGMLGWLDKAELHLTQPIADPWPSISIYLYDEADADWLQGLFAGLATAAATYQYEDSIYKAAGSQRVMGVPIMGVPTFVFDSTTAGSVLVFKVYVRPFSGN